MNYLREFLSCIQLYDVRLTKVRIGHPHDGGYILLDEINKETDLVYSFGVEKDVTFDQAFYLKYRCPIKLFDHTINGMPVGGERGQSVYFDGEWNKLGISAKDEQNCLSLETFCNKFPFENAILKMDVEGAEWDSLLAASDDCLRKFNQICIELHDLQRILPGSGMNHQGNMRLPPLSKEDSQKRVDFIRKLTEAFYIFHIHPNNGFPIHKVEELRTPAIVEMSFVRKDLVSSPKEINWTYTDLDSPNNHNLSEIYLDFWPFVK